MSQTFSRKFLFQLLSAEERRTAIVHLWTHVPADVRTEMIAALARRLGFRPTFIRSRPKVWIIDELARQFECPHMMGGVYYLHLHFVLASCPPMVIEILEAEGTAHDGVQIAKNAVPPTKEAFLRGIRLVVGRYPDREVCMYYDLCLSGGAHFAGLGEVIHCDELKTAFDRLLKAHPAEALAVSGKPAGSPTADADPANGTEGKHKPSAPPAQPASAGAAVTGFDGFTQLDRLLIRTVVASVIDAEHAFSRDQAEALVDEFLAFCPERHRSWFHPGFLAALLGHPLSLDFAGANSDRRGWKLVGFLLGTARSRKSDISRVLQAHSGAWRELMEPTAQGGRIEARRALLPIVPMLIEASLWKPLSELLRHAPAPADEADMQSLYRRNLEAAYRLIDDGQPDEAILILEGLRHVGTRIDGAGEDWNQLALREVMRRLGQAHMRAGRFPAAIPILEQIASGPKIECMINPIADLWLARAGLHSMSGLLPTESEQANRDRFARLDDGPLLEALQSARELGVAGTHVHLALGLLRFHQGNWKESDRHLSSALEGMMRIYGEYHATGLVDQVRFLLGLAIAELGEPARAHDALAHLKAALASGHKYPRRLKEAWIRALTLLGETEPATELVRQLIAQDSPRGWRLAAETDLLRSNPGLRGEYTNWMRRNQRIPSDSMSSLSHLLSMALAEGAVEEGERLLDDLESLARRSTPCAERFVELLIQHRNEIGSVWDEDSIDLSLAASLESLNRLVESAEVHRRAFFRARSYPSPHVAEAFLAGLDQLQVLDHGEIERLRRHLGGQTLQPAARNPGPEPRHTSVLFVGGNEIQARYEQEIRQRFSREVPWLQVTFRFPGWSSNWGIELEDCKRLLPQSDVVVIHRFVRTEFGRALRASCGSKPPWRSCTGTGRQSLISAIKAAALWISEKSSAA